VREAHEKSTLSEKLSRLLINSNLAPFAFPVRALRARTGNAGFDGAKSCRIQLVENGARFELRSCLKSGLKSGFCAARAERADGKAGFDGAKHRQNQLTENNVRSQFMIVGLGCLTSLVLNLGHCALCGVLN
jgi:hypothetical protein